MKHSIRIKLTIVFGILIASTFLAYLVLDGLFLEKYYMHTKEKELVESYESINRLLLESREVLSDDTVNQVYTLCEKKGIALLVLDMYGNELIRTGNVYILAGRLSNVFFAQNDPHTDVIEEHSHYVLQKYDNRTSESTSYLEVYGFLDSGQRFIMRMAVESIRESIAVFNKFFLIIGCVVMFISLLLLFLEAKRFTRPILELAEISKKMTSLDFGVKYKGSRNDEIGILGDSMNELSGKLETTISELKTANNQLQKDIAQKVEIDEMRKEFLSNVSHELKTPIALIQGYAEGLQDCVNEDEESRNYYCDVILDEANKMNQMVKQLLSLNKLEFGDKVTEMEHFDICQVIAGIKQSFDILFEQKNITCELQGEESIMVWADEFQIEEVLTNYISNAVNYCSGERRIIITTAVEGEKVRIAIYNTGELIPEEEQDKVWVKFYKVDKARSREYGGTGIGLSIVKAIMEAHNQQYGVYNKEHGVVFWFELDAKLS